MADHLFISYSRSEQDFATKIAEGLRSRGLPVWFDAWSIEPRQDWDMAIEDGLRNCATFIIILSPAAVTSTEVRGELHAALANRKSILPILYRPCEIPRQIRPIQYVELFGGELSDGVLDHLVQVLTRRSPSQPDQAGFLDDRELRNRRDILGDVRAEIMDRLGQILEVGPPLVLYTEKQPHQVEHPWDESVQVPRFKPTSSQSAAGILEAFDDPAAGRKLLVLGGPGSGKSTAMLQLASELILRAEANADAPVPVLISFSSWRHSTSDLASWVAEELRLKYGVRQEIAKQWLNDRLLAPLLDGLDEVEPERQEQCVRAINQFTRGFRPRQLVVCCRLAEYENLPIKLQLGSAVYLLPLVDNQMRDYLEQLDSGDLWRTIRTDPVWLELTKTPLFLRMMAFAYHDISSKEWGNLSTLAERRDYLIDIYIRLLLSRPADIGGYPYDDSRMWLTWLAVMLKKQEQDEFLIERIQPSWLPTRNTLWTYRLVTGAASLAAIVYVLGLLSSLRGLIPKGAALNRFEALIAEADATWWSEGPGDLVLRALIALTPAMIIALRSSIVPIETLRWSGRRAREAIARWTSTMAVRGLDIGAFCGLIVGALYATVDILWSNLLRTNTLVLSGRVGIIAGTVTSLLAVAALGRAPRLSTWFRNERRNVFYARGADSLLAGCILAVSFTLPLGVPSGICAGLGIATITLFSDSVKPSTVANISQGILIGFISWIGVAWQFTRSVTTPVDLAPILLMGGAATGVVLATISAIRVMFVNRSESSRTEESEPQGMPALLRSWARSAVIGMLSGTIALVTAATLIRTGNLEVVRSTVLSAIYFASAPAQIPVACVLFASTFAVAGAFMGASGGALFGILNGIIGPDIERRSVPNQGILQSARNVAICALIGMLVVGIPYGVINAAIGGLLTGTIPDTLDWLRLGLGGAMALGVLGGLVPGAACIQHFSLRLVLRSCGLMPWRYTRFLNHTTKRMVLQRIGGRYRFLHVLLRNRLAQMSLKS